MGDEMLYPSHSNYTEFLNHFESELGGFVDSDASVISR